MNPCAVCGAENADGQRFCGSCGASLATFAEGQRQRKTVTVVFCDVVGSTALGESRDPEAVELLLARYFGRMSAVVESHGGAVEKFIGDAVVAVFGVPVAHEDDALRALRAAVEMREAVPGLGIEARIGVNTGEIVTSGHGTIVTGDAVNVAARLEQAAAAGEVLVGAQTVALAGGAAVVEELEPLELKGKSEPVAAFRLVEVGSAAERSHGGRFVGRIEELALLRDAWGRTVGESRCELVTIVGEPGIGKSRLVEELVADLGARAVRGHCLSYGKGITYFPVVEVIKQLGTLPDEKRAAAVLRSLLGEAEAPTSADEIAWAFRKLLEQEAPLLVVFDDIQWAEQTFLDLVEHVVRFSQGAPLLLLCVARPELSEWWPQWPVNLNLAPLRPDEVEVLLDGRVSGSLRERIARAAGGNALFLTEMVAVAAEAGNHVVVPPTLKALLAARLDQLERGERGVLERGAIEGELFHRSAVEALSPVETEVAPRLTGLLRKELIRPERPLFASDDAYRFCHLLIRDAAYDALPKATRADLHERFADWLDQHSDDLIERDDIVGYHLEQAYRYHTELAPPDPVLDALAVRAASRLTAAGRRARDRADRVAAVALFDRAADLWPPGRLALLPQLAELQYLVGDHFRATEVADEAIATARARSDHAIEALAVLQRAIIASQSGDPAYSFHSLAALADETVELLSRTGDDAQLAKALHEAAVYRGWLGRSAEAAELDECALTHALRAGDIFRARASLDGLLRAKVLGAAPVSEFFAFLDAIPDQLRPLMINWSVTHQYAALMAAYKGDFSQARDELDEALRLAAEIGKSDDPLRTASLKAIHGIIELHASNPADAETVLRASYDELGGTPAHGLRSTDATLLADALSRQERDEEASEILDVADEIAQVDDFDAQVRSRSVRARILARRGQLAEAERLSREALEIISATDAVVLHGETLVSRAEVLRASGSREKSEAALYEALELFERKENLVQAEQTRALLATAGAPGRDSRTSPTSERE
jgi:class 3 adenylate cyclase/tetratricopeptide (TPR) repeat protein